jgi:hypothetical protein
MRVPFSRRKLLAGAGLLAVALGLLLGFGPVVRARVGAEARRRQLDVTIGAVRPGWFAVRLVDVAVRAPSMAMAQVHVNEVRVRLSVGLHVEAIEIHGGDVTLKGEPAEVRREWANWRGQSGGGQGATARADFVVVAVDSVALHWLGDERNGGTESAELRGLGFGRDDRGTRLALESARLTTESASLDLADGSFALDPAGEVVRAHAGALTVEWNPTPLGERRLASSSPPLAGLPDTDPSPSVLVARTSSPHGRPAASVVPPQEADPSTPLLRLPDLHVLRGRIGILVTELSQRLPEGAEASIDAMTWRVASDGDGRPVAFTIGPGPFSLSHTSSHFELRFATDPRVTSTSLIARVLLPTDGGDVSAALEGGPVSLSLLGIHEGAAGLVDVDKATTTGTGRLTLAGDGTTVTFDAELGVRGLSLYQPRLALDVVRGVDLALRARGVVTDAGEMRLDDFAATLGALHLAGSGSLDQEPDHVVASLRFELPSTACQALLDSIPTALLPALSGTKMSGTFGARGRFAFDTRSLDAMDLDYDVQDQCRIVEVPPGLARGRFKQPFAHRIYLPDGSTVEQTTGPGSPNWTSIGQISPYVQVAVMTTEDGAFLHHRGFNRSAIRASIVTNLKARRFVRGASTITMQLAKNLFLSRDKTLARKLEEVVLTDYLEQTFSKDEIMELYLNVIEFGPAVYGVTAAAEYYFGRTPADLDLTESLFLSSLLPAPLRYGAMRDLPQAPEGWLHMLRSLMSAANKRGLVTDAELAEGLGEGITFWHGGERPAPRPIARQRSRLEGNEEEGTTGTPSMPPDGP